MLWLSSDTFKDIAKHVLNQKSLQLYINTHIDCSELIGTFLLWDVYADMTFSIHWYGKRYRYSVGV